MDGENDFPAPIFPELKVKCDLFVTLLVLERVSLTCIYVHA